MMIASAETAWKSGRFDARHGPGEVLFGRMYEDASIELAAFRPGGRVFCIASAGCTAMSLAWRHEVVAVDINPVQLAYAERRIAGERTTPGVAERAMNTVRSLAWTVGWSSSKLRTFLDLQVPSAQSSFWHDHLDTRRFRAAFDGMLSLTALRAVYAEPFLDFLPRRLGAVLRGRMERCFARHPNAANPYARALLLGESSEDPPAPAASAIRLVHADAATYLEDQPSGSFDAFTLSNILDGADGAYAPRLMAAVKRAAAPGAVCVLRSFREPAGNLPANRAADDRSMLWGVVDVREAASL